ncbi:MAG: DEAD/DEAH box helicase [Actinomycetota bacterium]|jgi:hypothetical protein|nr:hypothetical protein [Actinomycetota bacterium]MED5229715.1 DEAD/DEAH box helicase [Actinomycetota bacterium]MED5446016.1 DEAD/DEAH box helicase [Actinomycetota bacterium]|tara:strand:- start:33141 stop:36314 length:3174 start_codon:yes stop_codon:yes gene_type:complete
MTAHEFEIMVQRHLDGLTDENTLHRLQSNQSRWVETLFRFLEQTDKSITRVRRQHRGIERRTVLDDLNSEADRIDKVLTDILGPAPSQEVIATDIEEDASKAQIQLAWRDGRLIAWLGAHKSQTFGHETILDSLGRIGANSIEWSASDDLQLPNEQSAPCVSAPISSTLGWLVSLGSDRPDSVGATSIWMGLAAGLAVKLVVEGKIYPALHEVGGTHNSDSGDALFHVRWSPALIDLDAHAALVASTPSAVMLACDETDRHRFVGKVLSDLTDSIVRMAAGQVKLPYAPADIKSREDFGEMVVAGLDGMAFRGNSDYGSDISRRLNQWAVPVTGIEKLRLLVRLSPPDDSGAWLSEVLVPIESGGLEPIEITINTGSETRRKLVNKQISRLERLFPELLRPGGRRRGEVLLSQSEAWDLMTHTGEKLKAAGFDVEVPAMSKRKATPILRITAESQETMVSAQQLADISWSAVFDDVELNAEEIERLASEARPLVESKGQWIELDKADLAEAAAALAEYSKKTQMSGAEMLRHALGLEGRALGGITLDGDGWAADLLRSVKDLPENPITKPEGFVGELRSYQADALAWINFLDNAGLGGCLALDMGLGKTPTTLANLANTPRPEPGLVIAPPAVVGNWRVEATRFVPDASVLVHHGPNRAKGDKLKNAVAKHDIVITTYGTAVRDIDQLKEIQWSKVVLDEAQAIKNPAAETSQQLRKLNAHSRIALTGTPIENGLGDLWSILDWANPDLLGPRNQFIAQLTPEKRIESGNENALKALNGIMVYRRTKSEPLIAAELPDRIDELDHCAMTAEQIGLYKAVVDSLIEETEMTKAGSPQRKGAVLAAITALKQICNHPLNYQDDGLGIEGRSGKLERLYEIMETVFAADERVLVFTHFATWGERLATHLTERYELPIHCYHGGLGRSARDQMVDSFQKGKGRGAMVLSLKAGGTGLNLTAANHVVLYDRWWNPAVEDQARDRVWRIGQKNTVIAHRLICPGTVDERVEEVVAGKRQIANLVLPKSSSIGDLDATQLQEALGIDADSLLAFESAQGNGEAS